MVLIVSVTSRKIDRLLARVVVLDMEVKLGLVLVTTESTFILARASLRDDSPLIGGIYHTKIRLDYSLSQRVSTTVIQCFAMCIII